MTVSTYVTVSDDMYRRAREPHPNDPVAVTFIVPDKCDVLVDDVYLARRMNEDGTRPTKLPPLVPILLDRNKTYTVRVIEPVGGRTVHYNPSFVVLTDAAKFNYHPENHEPRKRREP